MIEHDPRRVRRAFANVSNTLRHLEDLRQVAARLSANVDALKKSLDKINDEMTNAQGQLALEMSSGESDDEST